MAPTPRGLTKGVRMIGRQTGRILASAGGFLENVDPKWRGLIAILAAISVGFTGGIGFVALLSDFSTHETRIIALEDWRVAHEDTVSIPGMALAENNQQAVQALQDDMTMVREMVFQLYCRELPDRCEGVPR